MTKKAYRLQRRGKLLWLSAAICGVESQIYVARLLIDTGASNTVIKTSILERLGYDLGNASKQVSLLAGNGQIRASLIPVVWLNVLGQRLDNCKIVAHTLPPGAFVDGLLGMDVLDQLQAILNISKAQISLDLA